MNPTASRSAVPLMAGPICTETRVLFGTPLTFTSIRPASALPATPSPLVEKLYGLLPWRLPYCRLAASWSLTSAGTSSPIGTADFSSAATALG
jgi:hypothetical protein